MNALNVRRPADIPVERDWLASHCRILADSFLAKTGRPLIEPVEGHGIVEALWRAPFVLVSHNGAADPVLNYGNSTALDLWDMDWEDFTKTPSRYTAEPDNRESRARMLAEAAETGVINNYEGVRISSCGRRFMIRNATVWNWEGGPDVQGCIIKGQAATFSEWEFL